MKLADTPTLWQVNVLPAGPFLVIPEVSSERREYVPIGWLEPPVVPSNLVRVLEGATKPTFALLTSAMQMAWLRHIGGRRAVPVSRRRWPSQTSVVGSRGMTIADWERLKAMAKDAVLCHFGDDCAVRTIRLRLVKDEADEASDGGHMGIL